MTADLKPCPFCGGEATTYMLGKEDYTSCAHGGCIGSATNGSACDWNMRAPHPEAVETVAEGEAVQALSLMHSPERSLQGLLQQLAAANAEIARIRADGLTRADVERMRATMAQMAEALDNTPLPSSNGTPAEFYGRFYSWYEGRRSIVLHAYRKITGEG